MKAAGKTRTKRLVCAKHQDQAAKLLALALAVIVVFGGIVVSSWPSLISATTVVLVLVAYALLALAMNIKDSCRCIKPATPQPQPESQRRLSTKKARRRRGKASP